MKTYTITMSDGSKRTIVAERYEEGVGGVTFYDDNGEELETIANGLWVSISP